MGLQLTVWSTACNGPFGELRSPVAVVWARVYLRDPREDQATSCGLPSPTSPERAPHLDIN